MVLVVERGAIFVGAAVFSTSTTGCAPLFVISVLGECIFFTAVSELPAKWRWPLLSQQVCNEHHH